MESRLLVVPPLLETMLAAGRWPRNPTEAMAQNITPRATLARVQALAPEEVAIYLYAPPIGGVSHRDEFFNSPMADPKGIDFDLVLQIGDFGIGADAPILLDYRFNLANPRVIRLRWLEGTPN